MTNGIDWKNHSISFLSALLGIFIAFQLEDCQDDRQEQARLKITLGAIKDEIETNREIYRKNVTQLTAWLEYFKLQDQVNQKGELSLPTARFEQMRNEHPSRVEGWKVISRSNDSVSLETNGHFLIDVIPETGISTSSWQAGLYEGILNRVDNSTLSKLTRIYEWTEKDIGLSDREFYEDAIAEISNTTVIVNHYGKVAKVQQFKLDMIDRVYREIDWDHVLD